MANSERCDNAALERIATLPDRFGSVFRVRTPGGWLVFGSYFCPDDNGNGVSMALTFVPDEGHAWIAEEEDDE